MGILMKHADDILLISLKQGDMAAFDELYFRYAKKLMAFSLTFLADQQLAEEAVQEVFVRVWERRKKLDETKSFKSYLFQAVKFYMYNYIRDRKKDCSLDDLSVDCLVASNNQEDDLTYSEMEGMVMELIEKLPKVQKEVFKLNKLKGMNSDQIAHQMNLSKRTIEHHIYLASKSLKKNLLHNPTLNLIIFFNIFF
ncbi:RNA polymerase ECF-type sigma factor [Cyclobacterium qasimii M12-11B]|uniref:RNA polymerase ECF-type sigma factor n=3 Tax=Cyclobacterium qasimii TaxID=1350429 RepID=S7VN29_9BACT|nr:RNA polymerase ECF-type sigma factor [Cyclobacterium qasimii M12-11B]GEO20544.1 RNA polymerase sigma-70 factor [Cyclobacterium qasimii]